MKHLAWKNYLNFSLDILYAIARLDLKGDRLTREGFHKNLHFLPLYL